MLPLGEAMPSASAKFELLVQSSCLLRRDVPWVVLRITDTPPGDAALVGILC